MQCAGGGQADQLTERGNSQCGNAGRSRTTRSTSSGLWHAQSAVALRLPQPSRAVLLRLRGGQFGGFREPHFNVWSAFPPAGGCRAATVRAGRCFAPGKGPHFSGLPPGTPCSRITERAPSCTAAGPWPPLVCLRTSVSSVRTEYLGADKAPAVFLRALLFAPLCADMDPVQRAVLERPGAEAADRRGGAYAEQPLHPPRCGPAVLPQQVVRALPSFTPDSPAWD